MEGGLLLDVVVREGPAVLELLAGEDKPLLVWRDSFLVLDLGLDVLNGIRWLDFQGDGLAGQRLHEDLHSAPQPEEQVEGRLLLDVVVGEGPAVFQLLTGKDQSLLVWGNSLLVLDLGFNVLYGVRWLNFEGDGLAGERLHEDLHASPQPEDEVKGGLLLDVVIGQSPAIFQLLPSKDEPLLIWRDSLLVLDLGLKNSNLAMGTIWKAHSLIKYSIFSLNPGINSGKVSSSETEAALLA
jgi:hypothetical protein